MLGDSPIRIQIFNSYSVASEALPGFCDPAFDVYYSTYGWNYKIRRISEIKKCYKLYNKKYRTFPTGIVWDVIYLLDKNNIECEVEDCRNFDFPIVDYKLSDTISYRDHQVECTDKAIEKSRGILVIPTGGGKTILSTNLIYRTGYRALFIVPSIDLMAQTKDVFQKVFPNNTVGMVGDSIFDNNCDITVATIQTLWARKDNKEVLKLLKDCGTLIIDECHHLGLAGEQWNTWFGITNLSDAHFRFGLTATVPSDSSPSRKILKSATGDVCYEITYKDLVEKKFLVPVSIYFVPIKCPNNKGVDYKTSFKMGVVLNDYLKKVVADLCSYFFHKNEKILVILQRLEGYIKEQLGLINQQILYKGLLGQEDFFYETSLIRDCECNILNNKNTEIQLENYRNLNDSFNELKEFESLEGSTKSDHRDIIFKAFNEGTVRGLIGTVFGEGKDFPSATVGIIPHGGRSQFKPLQALGRLSRIYPSKDKGILIEFLFFDNGLLQKHSLERMSLYIQEGHKVYFGTLPRIVRHIENGDELL